MIFEEEHPKAAVQGGFDNVVPCRGRRAEPEWDAEQKCGKS